MEITEDVIGFLKFASKRKPHRFRRKLEVGDRVKKAGGLVYNIDNVDLDRNLGDFPDGAIHYWKINGAFVSNLKAGYKRIMDGVKEISFSDVCKEGYGECLEKALLVQMAGQRARDTFLIDGSLAVDGDWANFHAYNIVKKGEEIALIDAENPLYLKNGSRVPYIARVEGVDIKNGEFIVEEGMRDRRIYGFQ